MIETAKGEEKNTDGNETSFKPLWRMLAAVLLVIGVGGWVLSGIDGDWQKSGAFGDSFGVINTLFSGCAFAGIIFTILLQHSELKLQRTELGLQRAELKMTRDEISRSADAQVQLTQKQARSNAIQKRLLAAQVTANRLGKLTSLVRSYQALNEQSSSHTNYLARLETVLIELEEFKETTTKGIDEALIKDE